MATEKQQLTVLGASWCGYCNKLSAEYEEHKDEYAAANIEYNFVDCAADGQDNELCKGVTGFPTLRNHCGDVQSGYRPFEDVIKFASECQNK